MTRAQRSKLMSCIRSKDTRIERQIRSLLHRSGFRFRKHVSALPGKPDIVFPRHRVVVFLDGDFWHGYRCKKWLPKLSSYWRCKIARNKSRDQNNFRRLRRRGWRVVRIWEHEIKRDVDNCVLRITDLLR